MTTIKLNESQLNFLHMALELADQNACTRIQNSKDGEIRRNVANNQHKAFKELLSVVTKEMDKLYANSI
jgi:hypothetical protein